MMLIRILFILLFIPFCLSADTGDIGHWRDSGGSQIPGTTYGGMNFATQVRNDNSTYSKPNDSTIEIEEDGTYLFIANIRTNDGSNGRFNMKARFNVTTGSGDFFTTHMTGYSRDSSEDDAFVRAIAVYHDGSANDQIQIQWLRDTDAPTGGSIVNASDIQVVKISYEHLGIFGTSSDNNAFGGTTGNTVTLNTTVVNTNSDSIGFASNTVQLQSDNATFLVIWGISGDTGGSRTQRIGYLNGDSQNEATQSYAFQRNSANEYAGMGGMWIYKTATSTINLRLTAYRGDGVAADDGGADVDGSWLNIASETGVCAIQLPKDIDFIRSDNRTTTTDVTGTSQVNIPFATDVTQSEGSTFSKIDASTVRVAANTDFFAWTNVFTARNNITAGTRFTGIINWERDGVDETIGLSGNYTRGNQGTEDCYGGSFHAGGIYDVAGATDDFQLEMVRLSGGEGAGTDQTKDSTAGVIMFSLDEFTPDPVTRRIFNIGMVMPLLNHIIRKS